MKTDYPTATLRRQGNSDALTMPRYWTGVKEIAARRWPVSTGWQPYFGSMLEMAAALARREPAGAAASLEDPFERVIGQQ